MKLTKRTDHFFAAQDIIKTNVLTKFHEDCTITDFYKVNKETFLHLGGHPYKKKWAPLLGGNVFQPTRTSHDVMWKNLLANFKKTSKNALPPGNHFHEDWTINMASRVDIWKNAPPPGSHVFQPTGTIFELIQDSINSKVKAKILF
ncbi:hypothetical protein DPMN_110412 [Dreissena polymorpha]|uniref:Uncharacterized protein n=1 Tax=Dreissena polymorpha TaxID=45954 RepID=A0A9D4KCT0_DREPO|nr:hypothetical protein DPMN_110412 [Dreissena polymorpha]